MNNTGNSKDPVYEKLTYGVKSIETKNDNAYVEYDDDKRRKEDDSWLSLCIACFMCR